MHAPARSLMVVTCPSEASAPSDGSPMPAAVALTSPSPTAASSSSPTTKSEASGPEGPASSPPSVGSASRPTTCVIPSCEDSRAIKNSARRASRERSSKRDAASAHERESSVPLGPAGSSSSSAPSSSSPPPSFPDKVAASTDCRDLELSCISASDHWLATWPAWRTACSSVARCALLGTLIRMLPTTPVPGSPPSASAAPSSSSSPVPSNRSPFSCSRVRASRSDMSHPNSWPAMSLPSKWFNRNTPTCCGSCSDSATRFASPITDLNASQSMVAGLPTAEGTRTPSTVISGDSPVTPDGPAMGCMYSRSKYVCSANASTWIPTSTSPCT
mmetsp:Transcript_30251/g.98841  ORF Transcript_30251/g.98841 Transcript_30251/m.98841 type:complete len:331 (-) Transcript_30251:283-1275(-)